MKLRRLELLANYGDYLGQKLQEIRADLKAAATSASSKVQEAAFVADLRKHVYGVCFHNQIRQYIYECPLAQQICRDLQELLNVAPDPDTAANYQRVLLSIQNEYFDVMSHNDPRYWVPNEKAKEMIVKKIEREKEILL